MASHINMRGQALIEFAIILILVILVVAGGAELAITAYGSSKVSDAAKAGTTEWGQMISHAKAVTTPTPQSDVGLGDHAVGNFSSPSCVALNGDSDDYDDGIPDDRYLVDKRNSDNYTALNTPPSNSKSIYLFNPLPIDYLSCAGTNDTDPNRENRSRISILVNGYGLMNLPNGNPNPLYVPGLPKLNQAMYSMYQKVCLNNDSLERCDIATERLLFPPGKLCLSTDPDAENCPDDGDPNVANLGETGYYFFGASNNAPSGSKQYFPSLPPSGVPELRPTFQIECPGEDAYDNSASNMVNCDTQDIPGDANGCWQSDAISNACPLKVHVRYRSIFESFITFGLAELPADQVDTLLPYFYNPSKVGVAGSNSVKGIAGSEIGPIGATGNPTVKPFKDFRGCYESVNPGVLTYQVVSCN